MNAFGYDQITVTKIKESARSDYFRIETGGVPLKLQDGDRIGVDFKGRGDAGLYDHFVFRTAESLHAQFPNVHVAPEDPAFIPEGVTISNQPIEARVQRIALRVGDLIETDGKVYQVFPAPNRNLDVARTEY